MHVHQSQYAAIGHWQTAQRRLQYRMLFGALERLRWPRLLASALRHIDQHRLMLPGGALEMVAGEVAGHGKNHVPNWARDESKLGKCCQVRKNVS